MTALNPAETLSKLKETIRPGGYILIEEGYIPDESRLDNLRHNKAIYLTGQEWMAAFEGYVQCQQNEYYDIDDSLVCVTWILKSRDKLGAEK